MLFLYFFIALIVSAAAAWIVYRADKKRGVPKPLVTALLRALVIFLTLILIISPKIKKRTVEEQKPIVLLLQDNSSSIKKALGNDAGNYQKKLLELQNKLAESYRLVSYNLDGPYSKDSLPRYTGASTNLTKAISEATELYSQQNLSAIILASDGWYNEGNNPLYAEIPLNGSLYSIAIGDTAITQDIRIAKLYANKSTSLNSQWEVRADIVATRCNGVQQNVVLYNTEGNIVATAPISINSNKFDASVVFSVKASKVGLQQFSVSTQKIGTEVNIANNTANIFVEVLEEKKKILLLAAAPHPDIKAINDARKGLDQYELTIKMANELPNNLQEYAAIILHQIPSNNNTVSAANFKNKNLWLITGLQNNYFEANQLQKAVSFGLGIATRSVEPVFNTSFSSFSLPNNIAAISDILPPLSVSASDFNANANSQVLFNDKNRKPLWALLSGQHNSAVLCGEGLWRWRLYEYKNTKQHLVVDECIRQTLNFLTANNNAKPFRTELAKYIWNNPEHVSINAFLHNANNEQINKPEANLIVKDSNGQSMNFSFERNGNAYRIDLGALAPGTYNYVATTIYEGKNLSDQGKFMVSSSTLEDQENGCNYPLMYAIAAKNKGASFNTQNLLSIYDSIIRNQGIKPLLNEQIEQTDLIDWKWLFAIILIIATAEWLLRKYWMAM
jgi:hypothetical protein